MRNNPFIITVFGAESTGKTTLSKQLASELDADWKEEFARPYLETTGQGVTTDSMHAIWRGQKDIQIEARQSSKRYVVQDTDLFSTVGYWCLSHVQPLIGTCPDDLVEDAETLHSDLYVVTPSNIPFEPDPLRYGVDKRESPDSYWINLCQHYHLPYVVLTSSGKAERLGAAINYITERSLACVAS